MELERTEDELIITRVIFENREYYQDTEEIIYNSDSQVENLKIIIEDIINHPHEAIEYIAIENITEEEEVSDLIPPVMATITLSVSVTEEVYGELLSKLFSEFAGKKVGEEFTVKDVLASLNLSCKVEEEMDKVSEKKEEMDKASEKKSGKKEKKEKKETKPRKKSGYSIFQTQNKVSIRDKLREDKKSNSELRFLTVASQMWKGLSDEEKKVYTDEALSEN